MSKHFPWLFSLKLTILKPKIENEGIWNSNGDITTRKSVACSYCYIFLGISLKKWHIILRNNSEIVGTLNRRADNFIGVKQQTRSKLKIKNSHKILGPRDQSRRSFRSNLFFVGMLASKKESNRTVKNLFFIFYFLAQALFLRILNFITQWPFVKLKIMLLIMPTPEKFSLSIKTNEVWPLSETECFR